MRRTLTILAGLLVLSLACGDATGPLGPLDFGVVSGREQTAEAGVEELPEPAVAMVWRDADGVAHFGPAPLYAQTSVQGVAGAVVCVGEVPIEGDPIVPHARCTATQADGRATFHLTPSTRAGTHRTPIVAEVNGQALTPDTVTAIVKPGPMVDVEFTLGEPHVQQGTTLDFASYFGAAVDEYGNAIPAADIVSVAGWSAAFNADGSRRDIPTDGPEHAGTLVPIPADWCTGGNCEIFGLVVWVDTLMVSANRIFVEP